MPDPNEMPPDTEIQSETQNAEAREGTPASAMPRRFRALLTEIRRRCEAANIPFEEQRRDGRLVGLLVKLPCGRGTWDFDISGIRPADNLTSVEFERYKFLEGYAAICSYQDGTIEAAIAMQGLVISDVWRRVFGKRIPSVSDDLSGYQLTVGGAGGMTPPPFKVTIGTLSGPAQALFEIPVKTFLSLRIEGVTVSRHDDALQLLEKVASSVFFALDCKEGVALDLLRERRLDRRSGRPRTTGPVLLDFPEFSYDQKPMALYRYGRKAQGMPLLQWVQLVLCGNRRGDQSEPLAPVDHF